ncbi:MAG: decarboxylase [Betaproteobacteria bacterium]|nr:decarboxylase [Betaproteobacteria bacterium]MSQ87674.1 decarboxylase [Betaproteobacteria bacterium]
MDATNLANELIDLHQHPRQLAPFSTRYAGLSAEMGYAAARGLHAHRLAQGWKLVGRKNGFTNRGIWERYGVDRPMWGAVYDRTLIWAAANRAVVPLAGLVQPRIEPEICFKLKSVPPSTTPQDWSRLRNPAALLESIEWVAHAVEIVQCHHPEWKMTLGDCTANNALHGRLIVGTPVEVQRISGLSAALPFLKVTLRKGQEVIDQGIGANVLNSPLLSLAFLVEILAAQKDSPPLAAGEIISTGTLTDAHPVQAGETWSTDLHGFAVRGLTLQFT